MDPSARFRLRLRDITVRRPGDFSARETYYKKQEDSSEMEELKGKLNLPKMNRAKGTMKSSDLWSKKEKRQFLHEVLVRNNKIPVPEDYELLTMKQIFYKKGRNITQNDLASPGRKNQSSEQRSTSPVSPRNGTQYYFNTVSYTHLTLPTIYSV
eukprot:TRINITY_DN13606_c0_g1_i3.p1 TRINITY_DN13606_c0_g1~~TRINITY_DN13606_c0_g1_i3.p1  ORF type:complete len:154 (-),score=29.80 TRINITY_DN13606_c0_g1_i3:31-492(-)